MDAVMTGIMSEGYEAFVFPLVRGVYQNFLIGLCFRTLPVDNILFSPFRQIVENFLLQSYSAGGMYDVVHIILRLVSQKSRKTRKGVEHQWT